MTYRPPKLEAGSKLLEAAMAGARFDVTEYFDARQSVDGEVARTEAERYAASVAEALERGEATELASELTHYLTAMFLPDELHAAETNASLRVRQLGFAALQRSIDDQLDEMQKGSLDMPSSNDPVFVRCPALLERLTKDGLVRLRPSEVRRVELYPMGVFVVDGWAVYAHPMLAPARELVAELLELAAADELEVAMAIHPFLVTPEADVRMWLKEDHWYGIKLTAEKLDSLDRHDTGVRTFHGAQQSTVQRRFFPLLGTWFDWDRRSRHDPADPVKRLYVREVRPAADRHGEPLVAALNRELHAERDTSARCFTHVDGKICWYDAATYEPSLAVPDAPLGAPQHGRKLWRIDGHIPDAVWERLVGQYFRQNELIVEHLGSVFGGECS